MVYLNPTGHNWGPKNYDGYAMSTVAVAVIYSVFFFATCFYVWYHRNHPILRMRKMNLAITSVLILHVYLFMVFMVYWLNGSYPCSVEFWCMSIYLPIGIGLFQAQNQQLLLVSKGQSQLLAHNDYYKPLFPKAGGIGGPRHWMFRFKLWWNNTSKQGRYEGFVFTGIVVQFVVSIIIYCLSRKFNSYGIISAPVSPGQCRRGWEWIPSIVWQFLWNYIFGPLLIFQIRPIRDVYHWRLQTIMAIVAGLPGTPLWLVGVYSDNFASINKYWVPAMWFVPGLVTMELTTLIFPLYHMHRHNCNVADTKQALRDFDNKQFKQKNLDGSTIEGDGSILTRSTDTRHTGKMFSMESLEVCLNTDVLSLQVYASTCELNGENIMFLTKVLSFRKQWQSAFPRCTDTKRAMMTLYRAALNIFISLVQSNTATYPINIESHIYAKLEEIFGKATRLVACKRNSSISSTPSSHVTPWDEPTMESASAHGESGPETFQLTAMLSTPPTRRSSSNESSEHIISPHDATADVKDPLAGFEIPKKFNEDVYNEAYKSILHMVWSETWQRFSKYNKRSSTV